MTRPIKIVNYQGAVADPKEFADAVAAVAQQVLSQFALDWPQAAGVQLAGDTGANVGEEAIWCVANVAHAQFLGEHLLTPAGVPVGLVLVEPSKSEPGGWTVTLSHEVLEQIVDPWCNLGAFAGWQGKAAWLAMETADPVEDDLYAIGGVQVSNYVRPNWWVGGSQGPWDHLGKLSGPLTMSKGGYVSFFSGGAWQQSFGRHLAKHIHSFSRSHRRARKANL
jgi:hypothetical protein